MEALNYIQSIGATCGLPAALFIAWLFWNQKNLIKKTEALEKKIAEAERKNNELSVVLARIETDVIWIREEISKRN